MVTRGGSTACECAALGVVAALSSGGDGVVFGADADGRPPSLDARRAVLDGVEDVVGGEFLARQTVEADFRVRPPDEPDVVGVAPGDAGVTLLVGEAPGASVLVAGEEP